VTLTLRVDLGPAGAVGPGKIKLLELIGETGSISAAGRAMGMSYRQAWLLVDSLNQAFREPSVATLSGGAKGGGAALTPFGMQMIRIYRDIETTALRTVAPELNTLAGYLSPSGGKPAGGKGAVTGRKSSRPVKPGSRRTRS
jgi:molybdate transport system regulatory protein